MQHFEVLPRDFTNENESCHKKKKLPQNSCLPISDFPLTRFGEKTTTE